MPDNTAPSSPRDSQQQLAMSIARAVQLGLPAKDSEQAIQDSVRQSLREAARDNELTLARARLALLGAVALLAGAAWWRPSWFGLLAYPALPFWLALGWGAVAAAFARALSRGWDHPRLRFATPVLDALIVASGSAAHLEGLEATFAQSPLGSLGLVATGCALVAFSGALRLSRRAARSAGLSGFAAWALVALYAEVPAGTAIVVALAILSIWPLSTRVTRVIRNVIINEITQVRLSHLFQDAQAAIDAREEVLKIVAHDLRNPLSTIGMAADFLLEVPTSDEQRRRQLAIIKRSGERMNRMVHDLLDVARMEAGKLSIEPRPVAVADLFASVSELMQPLAQDRHLELHTLPPDGIPPVLVDPDRILQVFSNLIGNAIKFTPEGGHVTVRAERMGEKIRMSVIDTGPGIPQHQLTRLFERMWQAHTTDSRGIGLGLTIAQGIVDAHGERIGVESRVGEGTQFWFTVPIAPR